ncbi:hypothetical protein [Mycobacterium kansasii]|uniref:hypothetical protein n=1 Tax=Mycobacterium kansasii TaxID=1768 RepID=UPI003A83AFB6
MTPIHTQTADLGETTAGWAGNAPTQFGSSPIPTPAADPVSAAAHAVLADWPGAHEIRTGARSTETTALACANGGTAGILSAVEGANTARIAQSVEV